MEFLAKAGNHAHSTFIYSIDDCRNQFCQCKPVHIFGIFCEIRRDVRRAA